MLEWQAHSVCRPPKAEQAAEGYGRLQFVGWAPPTGPQQVVVGGAHPTKTHVLGVCLLLGGRHTECACYLVGNMLRTRSIRPADRSGGSRGAVAEGRDSSGLRVTDVALGATWAIRNLGQ